MLPDLPGPACSQLPLGFCFTVTPEASLTPFLLLGPLSLTHPDHCKVYHLCPNLHTEAKSTFLLHKPLCIFSLFKKHDRALIACKRKTTFCGCAFQDLQKPPLRTPTAANLLSIYSFILGPETPAICQPLFWAQLS